MHKRKIELGDKARNYQDDPSVPSFSDLIWA